LIVETTFDVDAQREAERAVETGLALEGAKMHVGEAALVAMTPEGAVRAMVGGRSYAQSPFNRAADASRQPGSAFKAVRLSRGVRARPQTRRSDERPPAGHSRLEAGQLRRQLRRRDYPDARVREIVERRRRPIDRGDRRRRRLRRRHRLGIVSPLAAVPALALGASSVTPLELTGAYATFANGGVGVAPYGIIRIRTKSGRLLYLRKPSRIGRVMSPENAAAVTGLMVAAVTSGTGKAARLDDRSDAGKTGTTEIFATPGSLDSRRILSAACGLETTTTPA